MEMGFVLHSIVLICQTTLVLTANDMACDSRNGLFEGRIQGK